jgi:YesN/AraC family two-component response regulator
MPQVSGLDVVRYLRRLEQTQHIPVILITGFGPDAELTSAAYGLGVADLLMKPVDPWALRTKVRYLYDAHQRSQALEREVRALRARLDQPVPPPAGSIPPPARVLAHPDASLPRPEANLPSQREDPAARTAPDPPRKQREERTKRV